jgi:peptide/nickel transport system permease protein
MSSAAMTGADRVAAIGRRRFATPVVRYVIRRLAAAATLCVAIALAPFFIVRALPGDPAVRIAGLEATPEYVQQIRNDLRLDDPLWSQFGSYLSGLMHGDLGRSYTTGESVTTIISDRIPYTAELVLVALALTLVVGVGGGLVVAMLTTGERRAWLVRAFVVSTSAAGVIPELVYGALLVSVFGVWAALLPISGSTDPVWFILPALAVGLRPGFNLARIIRAEAKTALKQQFIVTARSKRLSQRRIFFLHALPNISTAALTLAGLVFAYLLGGTVVVENLFALPGIGSELVRAVLARDYPVIQGLMILLGVVVVVVNATADILIACIDRRSSLIRG